MADQLWSWALTIVGATCFFLAGGLGTRKVWWAWYIGLFAQVLWTAYALIDLEHRLGFLVGVALYGYVYVRNCVKWTRERFPKRAPNGMLLSSVTLPPTVGPKGGSGGSRTPRSAFPDQPRRLDWRELPARRDMQCRFSWFSQFHGYVRCESESIAFHERHEAADPRTFVTTGFEDSVQDGRWDR